METVIADGILHTELVGGMGDSIQFAAFIFALNSWH
jgi:hypothetical protein